MLRTLRKEVVDRKTVINAHHVNLMSANNVLVAT